MPTTKKACFVGFDTSNYTTSASAATIDGDGKVTVIANVRSMLPVTMGERGLRQSDALFLHNKNLPDVISRLASEIRDHEVIAVGYSSRPRDVEDSYMPCFLAGHVAARAFAAPIGVPVYDFSHQSGHIMAALYSSGCLDSGPPAKDLLAFHLSGGTTEALLVTPMHDRSTDMRQGFFRCRLVGRTEDINAGQAIDRVGVAMGLKFPCGREMEQLAKDFGGKMPSMKITVRDGVCNLSGLENKAVQLYKSTADKHLTSAFVFDTIAKTVLEMTSQLQEKYSERGDMDVLYAGGVMSNMLMRPMLSGKKYNTYFASPEFSADNAAGIAIMTAYSHKKD